MKKTLTLSLLAIVGMGLAACAGSNASSSDSASSSSSDASSSSEVSSSSSSSEASSSSASSSSASSSSSSASSSSASSSSASSSSASSSSASSSSASSSSSSEVTKYAVTTSVGIVGGSLSLSSETAGEGVSLQAVEGDTITVAVTVEDGYRLNKLTATPDSIEFTKVDDTHYTFVMPASNVEVGAEFDESHSISTKIVGYYAAPTISGLDTAAKYFAGDEISFQITAASGYTAISATNCLVYVNDAVVEGAISVADGVATATVTMPDEDAEIAICQNSSTASSEQTSTSGVYIATENVSGAKIYGAVSGTKYVYFTGYLVRDANFSLTGIEYKIGDAETWSSTTLGNYSSPVTLNNSGVTYTYSISVSFSATNFTDGDTVTIRPAGEVKELRNISYVNTENLTDATKALLVEQALPGETVTIQNVAAVDGYYVSGVSSNDDTAAQLSYSYSRLSFTMPDADLVITFNVVKKGSILFSETTGISSAAAYSDYYSSTTITSANPGASFYVKVTLESGYSLTSVTMTDASGNATTRSGSDITVSQYYGTYVYFTMPSDGSDVTISFVVSQLSAISFVENENVTAFATSSNYAYGTHITSIAPGATFYVFADPADGKRVVSASINGGDGVAPSGVSNSYQYFQLTAPATGDLSISFETADNASITIESNENIASSIIVSSPGSTESLAANSILPGQQFYVGVTANEGYLAVSGSLNGGTAVSATATYSNVVYFGFTMPSDGSAATISFVCNAAYSVTTQAGEGGSVNLSSSGSSFAVGTTVRFYVSTQSFYSIENVTVTTESGVSVEVSGSSGNYSFVMPSENVVVAATFAKQATTTVALTHTDSYNSNIVSSISVSFVNSRTSLYYSPYYSGSLSGEVAIGDTMNISLYLNSSSYNVAIHYVVNGSDTSEDVTPSSTYASISHTVEEGLTEFYFVFTAKA